MFDKLANILLSEYHVPLTQATPAVRGPSSIMTGAVPSGFKGSGAAGIAPGREIPLRLKIKKLKKKKV